MEQNRSKGNRPSKVTIATILLYLALAVGIIQIIYEASLLNVSPFGSGSFISFLSLAFFAFLIYMIWKGRNWARITYLVIFVIFLIPAVFDILYGTNLVSNIVGSVQIILQIIALVFLFQKQSSDWFKGIVGSGKRDNWFKRHPYASIILGIILGIILLIIIGDWIFKSGFFGRAFFGGLDN